MSKLEDFLGMTDVSDIREEIVVKVNGKEYKMKIRAMSEEEHTEFQKRAQTITRKSVSFDSKKYTSLVLPSCIVEPDFNNAEFLAKAKCATAWDFLNKKFPAGVLSQVSEKIQTLSGFESIDLEIEEAKN